MQICCKGIGPSGGIFYGAFPGSHFTIEER